MYVLSAVSASSCAKAPPANCTTLTGTTSPKSAGGCMAVAATTTLRCPPTAHYAAARRTMARTRRPAQRFKCKLMGGRACVCHAVHAAAERPRRGQGQCNARCRLHVRYPQTARTCAQGSRHGRTRAPKPKRRLRRPCRCAPFLGAVRLTRWVVRRHEPHTHVQRCAAALAAPPPHTTTQGKARRKIKQVYADGPLLRCTSSQCACLDVNAPARHAEATPTRPARTQAGERAYWPRCRTLHAQGHNPRPHPTPRTHTTHHQSVH